jgi:hypothetical protein
MKRESSSTRRIFISDTISSCPRRGPKEWFGNGLSGKEAGCAPMYQQLTIGNQTAAHGPAAIKGLMDCKFPHTKNLAKTSKLDIFQQLL